MLRCASNLTTHVRLKYAPLLYSRALASKPFLSGLQNKSLYFKFMGNKVYFHQIY